MYGSSLSALSEAWESVAAAKKELTNVDAKIRQSGVRPLPDATKNAASTAAVSFANHSRRSKDNPNIERRVVIDYPTHHGNRKENIPPSSFPQPKVYSDFSRTGNIDFKPAFDEFSATRKELRSPGRHTENYEPDFNYIATRNMSRDKAVLNTSLSGRVLLAKQSCDSNALNRLKEKISQQRMNASISTTFTQETPYPERHDHLETEQVQTNKQIVIKEPMKRKVAHAPSAPTYKGFNQMDGYPNKPTTASDMQRKYYPKESKLQKRDQAKGTKGKGSKEKKLEQSKMNRKVKTKGKMQRIISPKKPVPSISTYSWRVGQEIRENLLKDRKKKKVEDKDVEETVPEVNTSCNYAEKPYEETDASTKQTSKSVTHENDKHGSEADQDTVMDDVSIPVDGCEENSAKSEELEEQDINDNPVEVIEEPSAHSEEFKISVVKSELLSNNAMSIINDLNEEPKEDKSFSKNKVGGVVDTGLKRRKVGKTSAAVKRKSDEECYPKQKIRHYDQEEIKKYMQKQQTQRRQQRLKEKQQKEHKKETQQQKLKELYNKQKEAVKENLEIGKRNVYGETFIKLSSKISSIMTDPSYNSSHESTDVTTSKDDTSQEIPTYPIPQQASSPQGKREYTPDEIFKDSLEVTGVTSGDKSMLTSLLPISPYKPGGSLKANTRFADQQNGDNEKPGPDVPSKASRVAAIHNTASALRKRLDLEAKRISCLVQSRQANQSKSINDTIVSTVPTIMEPQGFTGEIPGTHNIDEQASMNLKLQKMDEAAKKIQAFYRGHCTRKSLHWRLPSGRTLYQAFEGARRSAFLSDNKSEPTVTLASSRYPPITISNIGNKFETSVKLAEPLQLDNSDIPPTKLKQAVHQDNITSMPDVDLAMIDVNSVSSDEHGSTASLISEALTLSKNLQQDSRRNSSKASNRVSKCSDTVGKSIDSFPSYSGENSLTNQQKLLQAVDEKAESLRKVLEKHKKIPGDQYSVINIFTRNYPSLRRQQLLEDANVSSDSDTEQILAEAYVEEMKDSADEYLTEQSLEYLTEQSLEFSMEETLTEQSIKNAAQCDLSQSLKDEVAPSSSQNDTKSTVTLSLADLPSRIHISSNVKDSRFSSVSGLPKKPSSQPVEKKRKASDTSADVDSDISLSSAALSSHHSNAFSDIDTQDLKPVFSSTQRSMDAKELTAEHGKTPDVVDFKVSKADEDKINSAGDNIKEYQEGRMSPNTLERKLRAEINLYESVGSSLQQVGEMERVRNVVDAQQETVSLAQVLKSRQVTHQQELEKLSLAAKQRAMTSAQEIEMVKRVAAEKSVDVMKSIAEVKAKAAEEIAASAVQLAQIQQQTTSNTLEALNQVEEARQAAASAYKQSVDDKLPAVGELAAAIALNVTQQHNLECERIQKHTLLKSSASPCTLPSDPDYTDDFEGNKTGSSKRSSATSTGEKSTISVASEGSNVTLSHETKKSETSTTSEPTVFQLVNSVKSASAKSVNTAKSLVEKTTENATVIEESMSKSASQSDTIVEELSFKDLDTTKTSKTEMETHQDGDCSEVLFEQKTLLGSVGSVNEDSFSGNSEDKINSSLTEEELKHDFRMVLPSENHRRKSLDCVDNFFMGNDTSSDELLVTPRVGGKWTKKLRSKSPFADENTFTKFTANMVRQYIQEDEVRAKHQAALLGLREKAIIEKTKAEMAYLEMQKKTLKSKGTDEKMPPITKKQRAVLMRLQAEQSEIRRLKEAHKAASYERRSMLYQQKQIEKIRESTQKIWCKLEHLDKNDASLKSQPDDTKSQSTLRSNLKVTSDISKPEQEKSVSSHVQHSSDILDETPHVTRLSGHLEERSHTESIEESIVTEEKSKKDFSSPQTATSVSNSIPSKRITSSKSQDSKIDSVSESASVSRKGDVSSVLHDSKDETSSIVEDLKKLMYTSGKKYLTDREKKLESRKQQFTEIMLRESQLKDWRQKIIDEELRLKEDIRRVLEKGKNKDASILLTSEKVSKHSPARYSNNTSNLSLQSPGKDIENDTLQGGDTLSVKEDISSGKDSKTMSVEDSIIEEVQSESSPVRSQSAALFTERSKYSKMEDEKSPISQSIAYKYSTEIFENTSEGTSGKKNISASQKDTKRSDSSRGVSMYSKKVEDDSLTENTSDASDIEQRLKGLEDELENRRFELERLRRKKEKELLRLKEQELKKELQDVEQQILRENKENILPEYNQSTTEKSIPVGLSTRASHITSGKTELRDVEVQWPHSELSTRTSQIIPESKKVPDEKELSHHSELCTKSIKTRELSRHSELSDKSIEATKNTQTQSIEPDEDISISSRVNLGKSEVTNISLSVKPTVNEEINSRSTILLPSAEYTEKEDIKTERYHSKSEYKSTSNSKSNSISTATDMRIVNDKSDDDTSVSEQLISIPKHEQVVTGSKNLSVTDNLVNIHVVSKESTDIADRYGDDFEAESGGDGSPRSETRKSVLTEDDDLSELSDEILSEYNNKCDEKDNVGRTTKSSRSVSDELPQKSKSLSSSSKHKRVIRTDVKDKSNEEESTSEIQSEISEKSFSGYSLPKRVSANKSELSVVSQKNSIKDDTMKETEEITYEDSFIPETSKFSTTLVEEPLKIDSPQVVDSKELEPTSISDRNKGSNDLNLDSAIQLPEMSSDGILKDEKLFNFHLNDRVIVEGIMKGVIKFLGKTPFSPVLVAGIHLDEAVGTNNGTFQGTKYFDCDNDFGLFTTLERIKRIHGDEKKDKNITEVEDVSAAVVEIEEILPSPTTSPDNSISNNIMQKSPSLTSCADLKSKQSIAVEVSVADVKETSDGDSFSKNKGVDQPERDFELDLHTKSSSSSDAESLEAEIPSPQKVALGPMADGITESILKTLLLEAIHLPLSLADKLALKSKVEMCIPKSLALSDIHKNDELTVGKQISSSKPTLVTTSVDEDKYSESINKLQTTEDVNIVTKQLIEEAFSHMIRIKRTKQEKLIHIGEYGEFINKELQGQSKLFSLIAGEDTTDKSNASEEDKDDFIGVGDVDEHSAKLEGLQSVQDHLNAFCGEDDMLEETSNVTIEGRVILPPKSFRFEEPILQIPWTLQNTQSLVFSALNELTNDSVTHENLATVEPSDEYLSVDINNKTFNERYTKLYKKLIFDSTKSILCEINEFHELQKQCKPPWMKAPRKTFTKFTRNSHMLDAATLCQVIATFISTCLDLKDGRPSLEKLKRRLPLNLNKKDYVDAVLVEEIREEEPQWVNYDEDELKVKFQLADDILNNLLQEIVEIINVV